MNEVREPPSEDELDELDGKELPDREAMSTVPLEDPIGGFALPVMLVDDPPARAEPIDPGPRPE